MTTSIGFHPPLPCCTMQDADGTPCGRPATVGTLYPAAGGLWLLQPFCRECAVALVSVYCPPDELFPPAVESGVERTAIRAIGRVRRQLEPSEDDRSGWLNMSNGEEIP